MNVLFAVAVSLWAIGMARAQKQEPVQVVAEAFVGGDGFASRGVLQLNSSLRKAIPGALASSVSPIEKALLVIEASEAPLERVRYIIRYREQQSDGDTVALTEVRRFNLGPAIRNETIAAYGAENTAGPETFGIGPHVAWRIATLSTQTELAVLVGAGRRELSDRQAMNQTCQPRPCLSLDLLDDYADWRQLTQAIGDVKTSYPAVTTLKVGEETVEDQSPAYVALQLAMAAGMVKGDGGAMIWTIGQRQGPATDEPLFAIVIDRNLGQEIMTDAVLGVPIMGKDSSEHWVRRSGGVFGGVVQSSYTETTGALVKRP